MNEHFESLIGHLLKADFYLGEAVEILEKGMILAVLAKYGNNQSRAAKALGIHRNTLNRKLADYKIAVSHPKRKPVASVARRAASRRRAS